MAQPGRPPQQVGRRRVLPGDPRRARHRLRRSPAPTPPSCWARARAGSCRAWSRRTWRQSASSTGSPAFTPPRHAARPGGRRARSARWPTSRPREAAIAASRARGYLDGRSLAEVFAWLRPNDLIWNYWVNNYLQGKRPPAFDILYWNADTTRMTAALHHDFVRMALGNALTHPGGATVLGTEVDLSKVNVDSYIVAGSADHICPWQSCYRSTQLLGGTNRFVLSTNGHIAALVNPPTNPKSSYQSTADGQDNPSDPAGVAGRGQAPSRGPGGRTTTHGSPTAPARRGPPDDAGQRAVHRARPGARQLCPGPMTCCRSRNRTPGRSVPGPVPASTPSAWWRSASSGCASPSAKGPGTARRCCCAAASVSRKKGGPRSSTRWTRRCRWCVSTCRVWAGLRSARCPTGSPDSPGSPPGCSSQLGHRRFDVLGVSWGGALAQQLAFANPQTCRRVVLVATATGALMIPPNPWVLLKMATPRRHRDVATRACYGG